MLPPSDRAACEPHEPHAASCGQWFDRTPGQFVAPERRKKSATRKSHRQQDDPQGHEQEEEDIASVGCCGTSDSGKAKQPCNHRQEKEENRKRVTWLGSPAEE